MIAARLACRLLTLSAIGMAAVRLAVSVPAEARARLHLHPACMGRLQAFWDPVRQNA
jgi:hypothetical protein